MTVDILMVLGGLALLIVAGEALVRGAVNMALKLGIPALIVGLTIVAFGTSAPELLVSITAVLDHTPGIALGNVVGSNTANILLVLGVPALISVIRTDTDDLRKSWVLMMAGSLLFVGLAATGQFGRWQGLVLLAALAAILFDQARDAMKQRKADGGVEEVEGADLSLGWGAILGYLAAGIIGLPLGAHFLVDGASDIARAAGVSETVIGLTLVAIGTSLPELTTSIMAALKGRADVALGNVIGSNIFNLLAIIGISSQVGRLPVPPELMRLDLWVMLAASLAVAPFLFRRMPITRVAGAVFVLAYAAYLVILV